MSRKALADPSRLVVLDLVAQANQEAKIVLRRSVQRAGVVFQATLKFPILESAGLCSVKRSALGALPIVSILNALLPIVSMEQIHPGDVYQDDERFGLECRERVVERLDGVEGCFP